VTREHELRGKSPNCGAMIRAVVAVLFVMFTALAVPVQAREKDTLHYGEGLIVNVPLPPDEVQQAVEDVVGNGIIRGTKEYNKDEYVTGATAAQSTNAFPAWTEGGKVFYKLKNHAVDPLNFKGGGDIGTLAVRYVLQPQGEKNTVLRIDAVFAHDYRHTVDESSGSVESSEYKAIQDHLDQIELLKKETAEAERAKQEHIAKKDFGLGTDTEVLSTPASGESSSRADSTTRYGSTAPTTAVNYEPAVPLEQRVADLRHEVERLVKKPGAPLKSAPFHTASTLKSLEPGTEVVVMIVTPYWLGVETHDGQHGWIMQDELEPLP